MGESRFFPNALALVVQAILGTLLAFIQIKLLSNFLSAEDFGLFASLRGLSLLLSLLAANGLPQLLVRYMPAHEATGDRRRAFRLGVVSFVVAGALLLLLSLLVYFLRNEILVFIDSSALTGGLALWFAVATFGVLFRQILYSGLQGLRRMTAQVSIELVSLAAVLACMFHFRETLSITLLFRILGTVDMAVLAVGVPLFFRRLARSGGERPMALTSRVAYRDYLPSAIGIGLVGTAFTDVDRFLIAQILPLELIALFHVGARITRSTNRLLAVSVLAIQPELTRLLAEAKTGAIEPLIRIFLKVNVSVATLVGFAIAVFARDMLLVVASANYVSAVPLLVLLGAGVPLTSATAPLTTVMKATDRVGGALRVDLAWAAAYITLVLLLGNAMGLTGIGLANVVACLLQLSLAVRLSGPGTDGRFVGRLLGKAIVGVLASQLPLILTSAFLHVDPPLLFFVLRVVLFGGGCAVYVVMLKVFRVFEDHERRSISTILQARGLGGLVRFV